jgi:hypothetical protein
LHFFDDDFMGFTCFKELADRLFDFGGPVTFDGFGGGEETPVGGDGDSDWTFDLEDFFAEIFEDDFVTSRKD